LLSVSRDTYDPQLIDPTPFWGRRRYFVVMMAFFGLFNVYALRVNLSVAIVAMTENRTVEHSDGSVTYEQYFPWDSKQKGYILSSFFYGYLCTQVIGGIVAQKIGGNLVSSAIFCCLKVSSKHSIQAFRHRRWRDSNFDALHSGGSKLQPLRFDRCAHRRRSFRGNFQGHSVELASCNLR
jgi:ACS family sodium-dependent inorganic phosphate cotransporter